jgi:DNA-binding CsgD family transcriptional regulator
MENVSPLKKDNILFSCADDIRQLSDPLFKYFDIGNFTYIKVFPDMSRVLLDTNPGWADAFYQQIEKYNKGHLTQGNHWGSGYSPLLMLGDSCIPDALAHGVGEGVVLTKHEENCTEIVFITHDWQKYRDTKQHILLRNMDLLESFMGYFREEAKALIHESAKNPIHCPFIKTNEENRVFDNTGVVKKDFLFELNQRSKHSKLSRRELECVYYTSIDMTAKEIARQLSISPKTVERHLENAKIKLGCRNKAALFRYDLF